MDTSLLLKITCLLLATACTHVSFTAPTARQSAKDGAVIKSSGEKYLRFTTVTLIYWKRLLWTAALTEVAVILNKAHPLLRSSSHILTHLVSHGDEHQIRLTKAAILAVLLAGVAATLRVWCFRELGKHFTFELCIHKDHTLITTGPYGFVRHPSYTAIVLNVCSIFLLHGTNGSWVRESGLTKTIIGSVMVCSFVVYTLALVVALLRRMGEEDRELRVRFGKQWDTWADKVPYSLVPRII